MKTTETDLFKRVILFHGFAWDISIDCKGPYIFPYGLNVLKSQLMLSTDPLKGLRQGRLLLLVILSQVWR